MPKAITREEVQALMAEGAQIVEVLPSEEYEEEHLAGAINIPLKQLDASGASRLDRARPVVVYCFDFLCDMSPRAAWRLESLAFAEVYDYVAGKADWAAAGLPTEGRNSSQPTLGRLARRDVPTCRLDERIGEVRERVNTAGWKTCMVTNDHSIVLGRLFGKELQLADNAIAGEVMRSGPSTYRLNVTVAEIIERVRKGNWETVTVTTPEGKLIGMARREDLERDAEAETGS
jgi:rhodanese-related sulfurtransferase